MTDSVSFVTRGEAATRVAGVRLAAALRPPACVILTGPLGAGKTAFSRGIAQGLGVDPADVSSPTFTLVNLHEGTVPLAHVDLYRLGTGEERVAEEELRECGILELLDGGERVVVVEWGERLAREALPGGYDVRIEPVTLGTGAEADARRITISPRGGFPPPPAPPPEDAPS